MNLKSNDMKNEPEIFLLIGNSMIIIKADGDLFECHLLFNYILIFHSQYLITLLWYSNGIFLGNNDIKSDFNG